MEAEFHLLQEGDSKIPLEDGAVDFIHCSGVLHHMERPEQTLREFRRVLSPHGRIQVMVYNRDSLWFHLYCAYHLQVVQGRYSGASLEEVFRSSTDGDNCPVSRAYKPAEFINLARDAGLDLYLRGIALSAHEMSLFHTRFAAIMDPSLPNESREFLINLGVDQRGLATAGSRLAGIDACFAGSVAGF